MENFRPLEEGVSDPIASRAPLGDDAKSFMATDKIYSNSVGAIVFGCRTGTLGVSNFSIDIFPSYASPDRKVVSCFRC